MSFVAFVEKNWMLVATLVASGAMLVWPMVSRRGGREVGTLAATQLINTRNAVLLDVRETKEMSGGKLPNAIHIPMSQLSRPVIAYCERCQRARAATAALAKLGFKDAYHLQGGFKAWKDAGLPVQKT